MITPNMPRPAYEAIEAVNWSWLKHYDRSPAHAQQYRLHPPPPTPALNFGSALHSAMLKPDEFADDYVVAPKVDRRTKVGKQTWADFEDDNAGKLFLKQDEWDVCQRMMESLWRHEVWTSMMRSPGANEIVVQGTLLDVACKGMLDTFRQWEGYGVVVDLKSCLDARPYKFSGDAAKHRYHGQGAFYVDLMDSAAPSDTPRRFLFVAVEKEPPWAIQIYEVDEAELEVGRSLYRRLLSLHKRCESDKRWPAYSTDIKPLILPRWLYEGE